MVKLNSDMDIYADLPDTPEWWHERAGGGGGGPSAIWQQPLPRTVGEVKSYSAAHTQFENRELLKLKNWPLNGVATTLGGRSVGAVRRFLEGLPRLLEGQNVPVDDLNKLLKSSASADKREKLAEGAKKVVVAGAEASVGLLTIISAYLKWTGTT
jgi:hypothetical protein